MANSVRWSCVEERGCSCLQVEGQRTKGRPRRKWKKQVAEESMMIGLRREHALCRSKWSVGVNQIAAGLRESGHPHQLGILSDCCWVEGIWPPSPCWGYCQISAGLRESGHPHQLGILSDFCWVEGIWPPSPVGDAT